MELPSRTGGRQQAVLDRHYQFARQHTIGGVGTAEAQTFAYISSLKCSMVRRIGLGAAWPKPQIEASDMAWHSSSSKG